MAKLKNSIQKNKMKKKTNCTNSTYPKNSIVSTNWQKLSETLKLHPVIEKKSNIFNMNKTKNNKSKQKNKSKSKNKIKLIQEEIWFDGVDKDLLNLPETSNKNNLLSRPEPQTSDITKAVAIDCEMVGVGDDGKESMLARVSIVNSQCYCIYDKYVKPRETVTDYRTSVSGIRPEDLENGEEFEVVQKEVYDILKQRILVGHAVHNDLKVLYLDHPKKKIRDTSKYKPFRKLTKGKTPSLKALAKEILKIQIQESEHNSVQDAQASMRLYTMHRKKWEYDLFKKRIDSSKKKKQIDKINKQ